jgi:hypothetical protein
MSAAASPWVAPRSSGDSRAPLAVVTERASADTYAGIVATVVELVGAPADPLLINPLALILVREGLIDADGVTFGCDYDLNIRSIELERGYASAVNRGWLTRKKRLVSLSVHQGIERVSAGASARQRIGELVALGRADLEARARRLLLAE